LKLFSNILLLVFVPVLVSAQVVIDTTRKDRLRYVPTGIRVGTDALALGRSNFLTSFNGWEVSGDIDLNRYLVTGEYGTWERNFTSPTSTYENSGNYLRFGVDIDFLNTDPDNIFFLGGRYGRSTFSESMNIVRYDSIWGDLDANYSSPDVRARWLELTTGIRVKIWRYFWMGYTARFKFGLKSKEQFDLTPHDVPGYGRTDKETVWGFNYQLFFRIPVRKQPRTNLIINKR
jgi:hypothetical protein